MFTESAHCTGPIRTSYGDVRPYPVIQLSILFPPHATFTESAHWANLVS